LQRLPAGRQGYRPEPKALWRMSEKRD